MSERYSKLFALSENLYSAGAPVVIAAGALQKDNQTGKVFAQLKIRNIQDKAIKAVTVKITPFDTVGKPLGGVVDYQYLDLAAARDIDFGQKTPVMLKETATRSFAVSVSEVIFSDNSIWTASDEAWEPLSAPVTPEKEFTDVELAKQYRVKYGADCKCVFKKEKDLWRCACGAVNHDSEKNCHSCQREAAALAALNVEELKADRDRRLAAEQKKAAEEKAAAEQKKAAEEKAAAVKAKKTKKIAIIAAPIIIVAIVAVVLISDSVKRSNAYNAAVSYYHSGEEIDLWDASWMFLNCGFYKDAETYYDEISGLIDQLDGKYARLENGVPDESLYFRLTPLIGSVSFYGFSTYSEFANGLVWLVEDGQVISGYTENKEYIFTIVGDEIHVESKVNNDINGTYVKTSE